jgi:hypothetical protein
MASPEERLSWDDEVREGLMDLRIGLNQRGENLSMLSKVAQESITAPPPHDLHRFYGHATKEVEEGGANSDAVTLKGL